jgi:phosphoribosylformylglycinamidine synthase
MAMAAGIGAEVLVSGERPTAALFGERAGRVVVAVAPDRSARLASLAADGGVPARRIGVAGGDRLILRAGDAELGLDLAELDAAYRTPL